MAKDDIDLDFEDDDLGLDDELGNIDFGDGDALPPPKNTREAISRSLKDVGSGIIGSVTDDPIETATTLARKSLPPEISSEVNDIIDVASSTKDAMKEAVDDVKKSSADTIKNISKLLPKGGMISNMLDKIYNKLGGEDEQSSGPSKEQIENANIAESIVTALGEQSKIDQVNSLISTSVEDKRHQTTTQIMGNIAAESEHIRKFHYEITNSYYRKSLELQYKSLFVNKEHLEVVKTSTARFTNQLESIVTNTALPDILKARNTERIKDTLKQHVYDEIKDTIYKDFNPLENLKTNLVKKIKDEAGAFKDGLDGVNAGLEQAGMMFGNDSELGGLTGDSKSRMVGGLLGTFIRDNLFGRIGKRVGKTDAGKDLIQNVSNFAADTKTGFKNISNNLDNVPVIGGALSGVTNFLGDMVGTPEMNKATISKKDMDAAAMFDGRTQDSIVKVIPGLLSKILAQVTYIGKGGIKAGKKAGKASDYEVNYNFDNGQYENVNDIVGNIKKDIRKTVNEKITYNLASLLKYLSKVAKTEMSRPLRDILEKLIIDELFNPKGQFSSALFYDKSFISKIEEPYKTEYNLFIKKLKVGSKDDIKTVTDIINNSLKNIKKSLPNVNKYVENLDNRGLTDKLHDLGWMSYNTGTGGHELNNNLAFNNIKDTYFNLSKDEKNQELIRSVGIENYKEELKRKQKEDKETFTSGFGNKIKETANGVKTKITKDEQKKLEEEKRLSELNKGSLDSSQIENYFGKGGYTGTSGDGEKDKTGKEPAGIVHKDEAVIPEESIKKSSIVGRLLNLFMPNRKIPESVINSASDNESDTNEVVHKIYETIENTTSEDGKPGDVTNNKINSLKNGFKNLFTKETGNKLKESTLENIYAYKDMSIEQKDKFVKHLENNKDVELIKLLDEDVSKGLDYIAKKGEAFSNKIFGSELVNSVKDVSTGFIDKTKNTAEKAESGVISFFSKLTSSNNDATVEQVSKDSKPFTVNDLLDITTNIKNKFDGFSTIIKTFYKDKRFKGIKTDLLAKDIGELLSNGKTKITNISQEDLLRLSDALVIGGDDAYNFIKNNDFGGDASKMVDAVLAYNVKTGAVSIKDNITGKIKSTKFSKYLTDEKFSLEDGFNEIRNRTVGTYDKAKKAIYNVDLKESLTNVKNDLYGRDTTIPDLGTLDEETLKNLKAEFFSSHEYKNGDATNFRRYLKDVYEYDDVTIDKAMLHVYRKSILKSNPKILEPKNLLEELLREARPLEELKVEFYNSVEYKNGWVTDFYHWIDINNYKIKDQESTIRKLFKKARELDRKIVFGGAKLIGKGITGAAKLAGSVPLAAGKMGVNAVGGLWNLGRKVPGLNMMPAFKPLKVAPGVVGKAAGGVASGGWNLIKEMLNIGDPNGSDYNQHVQGLEDYYEEHGQGREIKRNVKNKTSNIFKTAKDMFKSKGVKLGKIFTTPYELGKKLRKKVTGSEDTTDKTEEINNQAQYANELLKGSLDAIGKFIDDQKKKDKPKEERKGSWKDRLKSFVGMTDDKKQSRTLGQFIKDNKKGISITAGLLGIAGLLKVMNVTFEDVKDFGKGVWNGLKTVKDVLLKVYDAVSPIVKSVIDMGKWIGEGIVSMASKVGGWVKNLLPDWLLPDSMKSTNTPKVDSNGQPILDNNGNPIMEQPEAEKSDATKLGEMAVYGAGGYAAYKVGKGIYKTGKAVVGGAKAVASGVSTVANVVTGAGKVSDAAGKAADVAGKVSDAAGKAVDVVKKPGIGSKVLDVGKKVVDAGIKTGVDIASKIDKKGIANKIISTLNSFKEVIIKKLGPKASVKVLGGLAAKVAARAVPIVGWGLLIYDAGMVIKYMTVDNMEFKSAVSKAVIGFDLFNDDEPVLDENGEPIKPDEMVEPTPILEETTEDKTINTDSGVTGAQVLATGYIGKTVLDKVGNKTTTAVKDVVTDNVSNVKDKLDKKGIANKIISTLNSFKETLVKKLGPKASVKALGVLAAKVAARAVPIVGWGLLIYDAGMVIKYMTVDSLEFKSAVSKAVLGFDLFNDDEPVLDENGEPIKPDEMLEVEAQQEAKQSEENKVEQDNKKADENRDKILNKNSLNTDKVTEEKKPNDPAPINVTSTPPTTETKAPEKEPGGLLGWFKKILGKGSDTISTGYEQGKGFVQNTYAKVKEVGGAVWDKIKNASIGAISAYFESGGRGPGTVSSGKGDRGGVSYGTHQLASKTGTLQKYLNNSKYGKEFNGLVPGSEPFNAKWKEIAAREPKEFAEDQETFIKKTHYLPQVNKLESSGLKVTERTPALQSAVYSAAVQFGPGTGLIQNALSANNVDHNAPDEQIIKSIYDYKKKNNDRLFKSSSEAVRKGTLNRAVNEENMVLKKLKEDNSKVGGVDTSNPVNNVTDTPPVPTTDNAGTKTDTSSTQQTNSTTSITPPPVTKTTDNGGTKTDTSSTQQTNSTTSITPPPVTKTTDTTSIQPVTNNNNNTTTVVKEPTYVPEKTEPKLSNINTNNTNTVSIDKSNTTIAGISDINATLVKSLETQIRMANTLDKILEVSSSRNISPNEAKKIADKKNNKTTSDVPQPVVNLSKSA